MSGGLPRTLVLLASYNGAQFIEQQLASIAAQRGTGIDILVSDDGSTDTTLTLIERFEQSWSAGTVSVVSGPRGGFAANFRHLILSAGPDYDYFAFSDQDDVWHPDKLERATARLAGVDEPAIYCSRTRLIDAKGTPIGHSPLFSRPPSFRNAIVQSLAGGNTMVLNARAFALLAESARRTSFLMHDWWAYMLVTGAGGLVHYDPVPSVDYRQHGHNVIGVGLGLPGRLVRLRDLMAGQFVRWDEANLASLEKCADLLTPEARSVVADFTELRRQSLIPALARLLRSGIYRQTVKGHVALIMAALIGRL